MSPQHTNNEDVGYDVSQYHERTFWEKVSQEPAVPIGFCGLTGVVSYFLYNYKNRGDTRTSLYLINMRLIAQGTLLSTLAVALVYSLSQKDYSKIFGKK
ncbi:conserved hypothetical protein [Pediculus humanus corporis]|uniref:HIG1 domain-containing protein n=1 Tax=Pediculus humanus subsp. corporis TaxID=121224 RepID=E0VI99_PEDHC|nr:uncharacterized protein Phum_PHUM222090 [Pediculus humanus corporis]EEB13105.1 conserved hypothetical protein [Pediculus humanus corporis]